MSTRFFTNSEENTLLRKFAGIFENNKDIKFFDALVGFFRSSGYFSIRPYLENIPKIRILVGINVDKIISAYQARGLLFHPDTERTIKEFVEDAKQDIQSSEYSKEVEEGILKFLEDVATKKIEIKAHPTRNLHAKIYIFKPEDFNEHKPGHVITGSSNLSNAGLGVSEQSNYEFNVLLNDYDDVKFASDEFEKLWGEGVSILPGDMDKVKTATFLSADPTPFEIYIKFLIEYFGASIDFDPNSITDLPEGFMRLSYQIDAISQGYDLLMKHNGFFLADVVGLGKTVVATLIAKKFLYSNGFPEHISRILIIAPPAIQQYWKDTCEQFKLKTVEVVRNGSLHKITNPKKYDLIIVDEAHKFRTDTTQGYSELQKLCKTPTERILDSGEYAEKKVILVSATPLNNRPSDIRNQILLFQDGRDSTLDVANLISYFAQKIKAYDIVMRDDSPEAQKWVRGIYKDIREKIIEPLTVRRTRTDLMAHEQYKKDLDEQGIVFPQIESPRKIVYELDDTLNSLYDSTMITLSGEIQYFRYRAISFLVPRLKSKYKNADLAAVQLATLMKTGLVKRIDSSFYAFKKSLHRFLRATKIMIEMFENKRVYIAPNLQVEQHLSEGREEELLQLIDEARETDPTILDCTPDDFESDFYPGLKRDYEILKKLVERWDAIDDDNNDPKLDEFTRQLEKQILDKSINPNGKLVVFSESKETIDHVAKNLKNRGFDRVLSVSAENRDRARGVINENFDANYKLEKQKNDYNIVITTEVLAEGVNLHRANVIVNYDTPWNSTRLMQRIGRINRIGTIAPKIYIYNFYPTAKVDNDIDLKKKAHMKLQAFHTALGEDSQIYSLDEEVETFELFNKYPTEERDERLVYLMELRKFKTENPKHYKKIKNLPLRSRAGRKSDIFNKETICFIKNNRRNVFYQIHKDNSIDELSFVETAEKFKTDTEELSVALHDQHHDQVAVAVKDFNEKLKEELTEREAVDVSQSPAEKIALGFLNASLRSNLVDEEESTKIDAAVQAVKLGRFQPLVRDINKLHKSIKTGTLTPTVVMEALVSILDKYPLDSGADETIVPTATIRRFENIKPKIIISESFNS